MWIYLLAVVCALPFYYEQGYAYIGTDKSTFFRKIALPIIGVAIILMLICICIQLFMEPVKIRKTSLWKYLKTKLSVTDWFMLLYLLSLICSYAFTTYKDTAWMGRSGWYMGLVPHVALIASYFILSRVFEGEKYLVWLVQAVTTVVFLLAVLNRFEIRPLQMECANGQFISTIGNMNWFCGYWSIGVWISFLLFWRQEEGKSKLAFILLSVLAALGFLTGIVQGSDSGVFALGIGMLALFCISTEDGKKLEKFFALLFIFILGALCLHLVDSTYPEANTYPTLVYQILIRSRWVYLFLVICFGFYLAIGHLNYKERYSIPLFRKIKKGILGIVITFFILFVSLILINTKWPGKIEVLSSHSAFTLDKSWASDRGGTWSAGLETWKSQSFIHKIVGVGPDCMSNYIYEGSNEELRLAVREQFPNSRLVNAHNEWITNLANLGVLGFVSFAGIIISAIYRFWRAGKKQSVFYIFAFCLIGYTANNVFSFQTIMSVTQMFVVLGVGECLMRRSKVSEYEPRNV